VLGLSASTRAFDNEHDELTAAVRDIAAAAGPVGRAGTVSAPAPEELCAT
jgi:hypothetical protein